MSCDGIRRDMWEHWGHVYTDCVPGWIRDVVEDRFAGWIADQLDAAARGGGGTKRTRAARRKTTTSAAGKAGATGTRRPKPRPAPPAPPRTPAALEKIFGAVKAEAERRAHDWTAPERAAFERKFDLLDAWLQEEGNWPQGKRPVKGESAYPRISSLVAYAALWDFKVWIDGLAAEAAGPNRPGETAPAGPAGRLGSGSSGAPVSPNVLVFFYGSYMNLDVLAGMGLEPERHEPAHLEDYELVIAPHANLVPSPGSAAYGIVATATHAELDRLYAEHALGVLGERYLPHPVLVTTGDGHPMPALAYLSHDMAGGVPDGAYVDLIAGPARDYGFPEWYLDHIGSIRRTRSAA